MLGASDGDAVRDVLGQLPSELPAAIAIVQHRRACDHVVERLAERSLLPVCEPDDRELILPGRVYVAPADYHLLIDGAHLALSIDPPVCEARPSIDVLFESAAASRWRPLASVLLVPSTDGAAGAAAVHAIGATTIVSDPAGECAAPFQTTHVVGLDRVASLLVEIVEAGAHPIH